MSSNVKLWILKKKKGVDITMYQFYKTRYGSLDVRARLRNYNRKALMEPGITLKLATSADPNAKMKDLSKGQFDWSSAIIFNLIFGEIVSVAEFIEKAMKNFTIPPKSKNKETYNHIPEKGVGINFVHSRKNGEMSTISFHFKVEEAKTKIGNDWVTIYVPNLWINMKVIYDKKIKTVAGRDKNGNPIQREQNYKINLNGKVANEIRIFYLCLTNVMNYGLVLLDEINYNIFSSNWSNSKKHKQHHKSEKLPEENVSDKIDVIDDLDNLDESEFEMV